MNNKQISHLIGKKVESAKQVKKEMTNSRGARNTILMLAIISALQTISFGVIMPIFARRFADFGDGLVALGLTAMAYSMASIAAAPFMGSLADRYGRRPLLLGSLAAYVVAFTGYLLATSTEGFFVIRVLAGALTAGLGPAVMGIVADVAPDNERGRWIGVVGGGSSVGWIVGPVLGGVLYDNWGYTAPFVVSVVIAAVALIAAVILVPETRTRKAQHQGASNQRTGQSIGSIRRLKSERQAQKVSLWKALPRPLPIFVVLLFIGFFMVFAWTFSEPQMTFYIYDDLGWTSARFGLAISGYGVASLLGQTLLGRSSDKFGRLPIIMVGLLLHSAQYAGLMLTSSFQLILIAFVLAGLGEALVSPALGAYFLDITPEQHKSRVMGIKGSVGSLGSVVGPLLAVIVSRSFAPQGVFLISGALIISAMTLVLFALRKQGQATEVSDDAASELGYHPVASVEASL